MPGKIRPGLHQPLQVGMVADSLSRPNQFGMVYTTSVAGISPAFRRRLGYPGVFGRKHRLSKRGVYVLGRLSWHGSIRGPLLQPGRLWNVRGGFLWQACVKRFRKTLVFWSE